MKDCARIALNRHKNIAGNFLRSLTVIEDVDCANDGRRVVVIDSSRDIAGEEVIILEEGIVLCWR